jgi:hypothetical protein
LLFLSLVAHFSLDLTKQSVRNPAVIVSIKKMIGARAVLYLGAFLLKDKNENMDLEVDQPSE